MNEQTSIDNINSTVFVFLLACPFLGFSRKELFACEGIDLLKLVIFIQRYFWNYAKLFVYVQTDDNSQFAL